MYRSSNPIVAAFGLLDYDPKHPPDDVATVKTESGAVVPFIVRVETGYVDRDQYKIAVLARPNRTWAALDPPSTFAHKLLVTPHGASCDITYGVGGAPSVAHDSPIPSGLAFLGADIAERALGQGYVVMSTAADNSGHNCNLPTQAESLLMAKERVIERYGTVKYTIGSGCSGGSLAIQWIANAYPGIYDGILPTCSFPNAWSSATQVFDCPRPAPLLRAAGALVRSGRVRARSDVGRLRQPEPAQRDHLRYRLLQRDRRRSRVQAAAPGAGLLATQPVRCPLLDRRLQHQHLRFA